MIWKIAITDRQEDRNKYEICIIRIGGIPQYSNGI